MAGYLMGLDSEESLTTLINDGVYPARMSLPKRNKWGIPQEGIYADFSSMKAGDNIYFFIKRKIYGVGELIKVDGDCKYLNFPKASEPKTLPSPVTSDFLFLYPRSDYNALSSKDKDGLSYAEYIQQYRFVCFFKPSPYYFENGIDMDDMLTSEPQSFKILRDFYQKSFIKLDDIENQAFKNLILRRNYISGFAGAKKITSAYASNHTTILGRLATNNYELNVAPLLENACTGDKILHEMAIEAAIANYIASNHSKTKRIFGKWDYISHQVPASPPKPNAYLDRIDLFGYSYIPKQFPTKSNFLIVEVKKDNVTKENLSQLMKYVDFIKDEYAYNDYSMINAFLVGYDFDADCISTLKDIVTRNYIHGIRPSTTKVWKNVKLVKYSFNSITKELDFKLIKDANLL